MDDLEAAIMAHVNKGNAVNPLREQLETALNDPAHPSHPVALNDKEQLSSLIHNALNRK